MMMYNIPNKHVVLSLTCAVRCWLVTIMQTSGDRQEKNG